MAAFILELSIKTLARADIKRACSFCTDRLTSLSTFDLGHADEFARHNLLHQPFDGVHEQKFTA